MKASVKVALHINNQLYGIDASFRLHGKVQVEQYLKVFLWNAWNFLTRMHRSKKGQILYIRVGTIKSLWILNCLIFSTSFMDSMVILQRPLTNEQLYQCGWVVSVGEYTSSVVMFKYPQQLLRFLNAHTLILLSLAVTYYCCCLIHKQLSIVVLSKCSQNKGEAGFVRLITSKWHFS